MSEKKNGGQVQVAFTGDPSHLIKTTDQVEKNIESTNTAIKSSASDAAKSYVASSEQIDGALQSVIDVLETMYIANDDAMKEMVSSMNDASTAMTDSIDDLIYMFDELVGALVKTEKEVDKDTKEMKKDVKSFADECKAEVEKAAKAIEDAFDKLDGMSLKLMGIGGSMLAATGLLTKFGSDAEETANKFEVAFRQNAATVRQWVQQTSDEMKIAKSSIEEYSSSFQLLFNPAGMNTSISNKISQDYTKLVYDLSSIYNTSVEEAFTALKAATVEEFEPMRRFAATLSAAKVEQEALRAGLIRTKDEMNDAARIQAVYNLVMEATVDAQGDWVRTSDGVANKTKQLMEHVKKTTEDLSEDLLPVVASFLDKLMSLMDLVEEIPDPIKSIGVEFLAVGGAVIFTGGGLLKIVSIFRELKKEASSALPAIQALFSSIGGAGPFALLAVAIGAVVWTIADWIDKAEEAIEQLETTKANVGTLAEEFDTLAGKQKKTNDELERYIELQKELGKAFPSAIKQNEDGSFEIDSDILRKYELLQEMRKLMVEVAGEKLPATDFTLSKIEETEARLKENQARRNDPAFENQSEFHRNTVENRINEDTELLKGLYQDLMKDLDIIIASASEEQAAKLRAVKEAFTLGTEDAYKAYKKEVTYTTPGSDPGIKDAFAEYEEMLSTGQFKSYQQEIKYLQDLSKEYNLNGEQKVKVNDRIFDLAMEQYEFLAKAEKWTAEERIAHIEQTVQAYAISTGQLREIERELIDLRAQAADETYRKAVQAYEQETEAAELSAEEKKKLFREVMEANGINTETHKAAQERLSKLDLDKIKEERQRASEHGDFVAGLEKERIDLIEDSRIRELASLDRAYQEKKALAEKNGWDLAELEKNHQDQLASINKKYDLQNQQKMDADMAWKYQQNELSHDTYIAYLKDKISFFQAYPDELDGHLKKIAQVEKSHQDALKSLTSTVGKDALNGREKDIYSENERYEKQKTEAEHLQVGNDILEQIEENHRKKLQEINDRHDEEEKRLADEKEKKALQAAEEQAQKEQRLAEETRRQADQEVEWYYRNGILSYEGYLNHLKERRDSFGTLTPEWISYDDKMKSVKDKHDSEDLAAHKKHLQAKEKALKDAFEEEEELYQNRLPWQKNNLDERYNQYKAFLEQMLNDEKLSTDEHTEVLEKLKQLDKDYLADKADSWERTLSKIHQYSQQLFAGMNFDFDFKGEKGREDAVADIADQFAENASDLAAKGLGALADTLLPGIGPIVEDVANVLFDIFSDDNWEEKLDAWLDGVDKGAEEFWKILERILSNLPKLLGIIMNKTLEVTGNLVGEFLEWIVNSIIDFINWSLGWLGVDIDHVDWGWSDKDDPDKPDKDPNDDSGKAVTYGNITGPLADRFDHLIDVLSNWDQMPGLFDGIRAPIGDIRNDVAAIRQLLATFTPPAGNQGGAGSQTILQFQEGAFQFNYDEVKDQSVEEFFQPIVQEPLDT